MRHSYRNRVDDVRGTERRRTLTLTTLVVWSVLVAAVVPGVAAGALSQSSATDVRGDVEQAVGDSVNVTATPGAVAAGTGDAIELSGATTFDTGEIRLYLIGPRGTFLDTAGSADEMAAAPVAAGTFTATYEAFSRRGLYRLLVVSPRGDGVFESTETLDRDALPTGLTQQQAVDIVRAAYGGDEVVELSLRGQTPALGIDPVSDDGTVPQAESVAVSGTTNRGNGTTVFVDLVDGSGRVVTRVKTTVDAQTGTWEAEFDFSELERGAYTVFADDTASTASATVIVVSETTTPTETPAEIPSPDDPDTVNGTSGGATETNRANTTGTTNASANTTGTTNASANTTGATNASANESVNGTANTTAEGSGSTGGQVPGFGIGAAVAALALAVVAAGRRTRD